MDFRHTFSIESLETRQMMAADIISTSLFSAIDTPDRVAEIAGDLISETATELQRVRQDRTDSDTFDADSLSDHQLGTKLQNLVRELKSQGMALGAEVLDAMARMHPSDDLTDVSLTEQEAVRLREMVIDRIASLEGLLEEFDSVLQVALARDLDVAGRISQGLGEEIRSTLDLGVGSVDALFGGAGESALDRFTGGDAFDEQIGVYMNNKMDKVGQQSNRGDDFVKGAASSAGGAATVAGALGNGAVQSAAVGQALFGASAGFGVATAGLGAAFAGGLAIGTGFNMMFEAVAGKTLGDVIYEAVNGDEDTVQQADSGNNDEGSDVDETETDGGSDGDEGNDGGEDAGQDETDGGDSTPAPDSVGGDNPNPDTTVSDMMSKALERPTVAGKETVSTPADPFGGLSEDQIAQQVETMQTKAKQRQNWAINPGDHGDTSGQPTVETVQVVPDKQPVIDPGSPAARWR